MDEDGIEVPVAFIDPNGETVAKVTFTQRAAKITFVPSRLSNVDFREGDIETTVTTEDNQTWAVYGNITEAGGGTALWITKTSPTSQYYRSRWRYCVMDYQDLANIIGK